MVIDYKTKLKRLMKYLNLNIATDKEIAQINKLLEWEENERLLKEDK